MALTWTLAYQPKTKDDLLIEPSTATKVVELLDKTKKSRKAIFLHGPTGVGKTTLVYSIAESLELEVLELNASDKRSKNAIGDLLNNATKQASLIAKGKIILIDEIDGLSGRHDRGGVQEVIRIIKESAFPVIITAVNPWDSKFSKLRSSSHLVEIKPASVERMKDHLKSIAEQEGIKAEERALTFISRIADGDIRAAINDLQAAVNNSHIRKEEMDEENQRDLTVSIPQARQTVFKSKDFDTLKQAFSNFEGNFDDLFLWIDYNLPKEYENTQALAKAYEYLSMADIYNQRIRRWQYWRYLVYINLFLSCGIGISKEDAAKKFVKYQQSSRILKIWMSKRKYAKRDAIAEKIARKIHWNKAAVIKNFAFYKTMAKEKAFLDTFAEEMDLSDDEKTYMKN